MIKIYDSKSKKLKSLVGENTKIINIYLCGPTVYNYIHIGNLRPVIIMDVLYRLLLELNYQVNYVQNITDIDDKIIIKAQTENKTEQQVSDFYYKTYLHDLMLMNVKMPNLMPRVTEYVPEIIAFVAKLITKNGAYNNKNDVYFLVDKVSDYGVLGQKKIAELTINKAVIGQAKKHNKHDFALWKQTSSGLTWSSPWGNGRPGWHTECAVFVDQIFKSNTISLHSGGIDLKFPHHENERAQYLIANNCELANIWWHIGHVNVASEKMSKSLNNFLLVKDFYQQYSPNVLRYLLLNHDHQQPLNFNDALLNEAVNIIKKYELTIQNWLYFAFENNINQQLVNITVNAYKMDIIKHLQNNLNTTNVFTMINHIIKEINKLLVQKDDIANLKSLMATFMWILNLLGFNFVIKPYNDVIKAKIRKWKALRWDGKYQEADQIRLELQQLEILVK